MKVLRAIYRYWSTLIILAVVVQIGAAGYGAFYSAQHLKDKGDVFAHKGWEHGWDFHTGLGWLTVYGILIALVLALIARIGRPRIWWALALAVAGVLQIVFALVGEDHPAVGVLHPLNAVVIAAFAGSIAGYEWRTWRATRTTAPQPA